MKRRLAVALAFALVLGPASPARALATAGVAELHTELEYSDLASVHWVHPGDGCDCGPYCFQLVHRDPPGASFRGLQRSLSRINAPAAKERPLVFAQSCADGHWIVYDLEREEYLADTSSYDQALTVWRAHWLPEPRFADAAHGAKGLHPTWRSFSENFAFASILWTPLLAAIAFPVGIFLALVLFLRWRRTRRPGPLVGTVLALLLTLPGFWITWMLVARAFAHPGH